MYVWYNPKIQQNIRPFGNFRGARLNGSEDIRCQLSARVLKWPTVTIPLYNVELLSLSI